ncbi:MAG: hypothetical protein P8X74_23525 [Reinekea sp.]
MQTNKLILSTLLFFFASCSHADDNGGYDFEQDQWYELDKLVRIQYHALLETSAEENKLKKDQGEWEETVRSQCDSIRCLIEVYQGRLRALGGTLPEKANFTLGIYSHEPICEEYLVALNRTPLHELKACELPDLEGSAIQPVQFIPLKEDELKTTDKTLYEQMNPTLNDWVEKWPERKKEYDAGYRKLAEAYWDINNDGNKERIIQMSMPNYRCIPIDAGDRSDMRSDQRHNWQQYSVKEKVGKAKQYGYKNYYIVLDKEKMSYTGVDMFAKSGNKYISVDQDFLSLMNVTGDFAIGRYIIEIREVKTVLDEEVNTYQLGSKICRFWLNS